jgi:hypothetical protein
MGMAGMKREGNNRPFQSGDKVDVDGGHRPATLAVWLRLSAAAQRP